MKYYIIGAIIGVVVTIGVCIIYKQPVILTGILTILIGYACGNITYKIFGGRYEIRM